MRLRPATPDDAPLLSDLAMRSKASWGYDADFLEACRRELTITAARIATETMVVAEDDDGVVGFFSVSLDDTTAELEDLFVHPGSMGIGAGSHLLAHAIATATDAGATTLRIEADPHAEAWYLAKGATRIGEVASGSVPDRHLPLLVIDLN